VLLRAVDNPLDKCRQSKYRVTAGGVHYHLTELSLAPGETRAIDIRQLRDAGVADVKGHRIPDDAADGAVDWIRLDNVPVSGRVVVISRAGGLASSYDCCTCPCPANYSLDAVNIVPSSFSVVAGDIYYALAYASYTNCNGDGRYSDVTTAQGVVWSSTATGIATIDTGGLVTGVAGGSSTITFTMSGYKYQPVAYHCSAQPFQAEALATATVQVPTSLRLVSTTSQGPGSCSSGSAGWDRRVIWQVLDQAGQVINKSMSVSDSIAITSPNTCGASKITGSATTDSTGRFSDHYYLCSTGCVGGTCQTNANQTYTVNGSALSSDIKSLVYTCTSITINGQ
jgi:Bacterial Ig-like domain (group 2)